MASKASNFSDLIQRITASTCLLYPLSFTNDVDDSDSDKTKHEIERICEEEEEYENAEGQFNLTTEAAKIDDSAKGERIVELESLIGQVFDAVSDLKRAYVSQQEAHCPWDPDMAVVAELRRLSALREKYRRSGGGRRLRPAAATLREVVAPYEAAMEELKMEVKVKRTEVDSLRDKLRTATSFSNGGGGKLKGKSIGRVSSTNSQVVAAPAMELFEATMSLVKEASKSFTSLLLSLMKSAHLDIAAAVRSIETASSAVTTTNNTAANTTFMDNIVGSNHAKYALESYVNRKIFQGFDHETFYMDGSLSSILNPDQHRRDCFTQYRDMKAMDPIELLSILPTCSFGKFCFKKYLSIVHPKMEELLFGDLEQRRQVLDGHHPRSQFYVEFSRLAKAVWLLHLLEFSFDPPPTHFEASKGADFHSQFMESVARISGNGGGARVGASMVVGFPVSPGFKLANGSIIKARVFLVSKNG